MNYAVNKVVIIECQCCLLMFHPDTHNQVNCQECIEKLKNPRRLAISLMRRLAKLERKIS